MEIRFDLVTGDITSPEFQSVQDCAGILCSARPWTRSGYLVCIQELVAAEVPGASVHLAALRASLGEHFQGAAVDAIAHGELPVHLGWTNEEIAEVTGFAD